ncbi:hypothetical protein B0H17DRAFT_955858, partial [Mycena rosella]
VGEALPCGLCGRSGCPECQVLMKANGSGSDMQTKCQYALDFRYKTADEGKSKTACRNVLILCGLFPGPKQDQFVPTVWRYNMPEHLRLQDSEYASPQQPEGIAIPLFV